MQINVNPANPNTSDMTTRTQDVMEEQNAPVEEAATPIDPKVKKRNDEFRTRIAASKAYRRKLIPLWSTNIDYRRGKPFTSQSDSDQVAVNLDWSLTKQKQAALFSQVPEVRINHGEALLPKAAPWAMPFQKRLNEIIRISGIEAAMEECLPDCINAAGFGAVLVSYNAMTEDTQVPSIDFSTLPPEVAQEAQTQGTINGEPVPMETVPRITDVKYESLRLSPADFLWPLNFAGSDFDNAPWLGRSGRITWTEAVRQFKLTDEDESVIFGDDRPVMDRLTLDVDKEKTSADKMVSFDEIFFKEYRYDENAKSFSTIHHLVFVEGKDEPVVDEPWKGQKIDEATGQVTGAFKYPIRVLTLAYLTDEPIPPSDSAIGRPQVDEINKARTQMILQRERSLPLRWIDINRADPQIVQGMMRGKLQAFVPIQGDGARIIGEVSTAKFPPETFKFYQIAKSDLNQEWADPQIVGTDVETAKESQNIAQAAMLPRTKERARTASFFVGIAEVLGGLACIYEDAQQFGQGFDPANSKLLQYSVLSDSTVLLDASQKLERLNHFINEHAKSGWVNIEPVLHEIATLSGLDPSVVIQAPQPKPPVEPNVSLRLTGVEDLLNPLSLAMLIKSGQAPSPDQIDQAKKLIQSAVELPPDGLSLQAGDPTMGQAPLLPGLAGATAGPLPAPPPPALGDAHPQWAGGSTINKRTEGGQ